MRRRMFLGKIHRCVVTQADLDYEGSVTIDAELMEAAGILEHEEVQIWNVTRGTRLATYTLAAPAGSKVICINGAAAHRMKIGDTVIIAAFADMSDEEARVHKPRVVLCNSSNEIVSMDEERPGPQMPRPA
ncbi:MAG: aspartate 1-decarboxylase [Myxococcota bacterium]